jgi:hypothetical protein
LVVAHFYTRIKKWDGARIHADRALTLAKLSGDPKTIAEAQHAVALVPVVAPALELPPLPTDVPEEVGIAATPAP